jgi:folate-binding protein YgfZ
LYGLEIEVARTFPLGGSGFLLLSPESKTKNPASPSGSESKNSRESSVRESGAASATATGAMKKLFSSLVAAGASPAAEDSLEPLRVAAGIPELGRELSEEYNPWEVGLDRAISLTKGCYLGQEVVARLHTYKKVQRRLALMEIDGPSLPEAGAVFLSNGADAGQVTSAAFSPDSGRPLAMGFLRIGPAAPGSGVTVSAGSSDRPVRFIPLPFLDSR